MLDLAHLTIKLAFELGVVVKGVEHSPGTSHGKGYLYLLAEEWPYCDVEWVRCLRPNPITDPRRTVPSPKRPSYPDAEVVVHMVFKSPRWVDWSGVMWPLAWDASRF
ncbi:hypothetical protein BHE74_00032567 [Ensete ventricosum]|nr:hypothetical protein BHE74_00032567 [Ensete ventricosum]